MRSNKVKFYWPRDVRLSHRSSINDPLCFGLRMEENRCNSSYQLSSNQLAVGRVTKHSDQFLVSVASAP